MFISTDGLTSCDKSKTEPADGATTHKCFMVSPFTSLAEKKAQSTKDDDDDDDGRR